MDCVHVWSAHEELWGMFVDRYRLQSAVDVDRLVTSQVGRVMLLLLLLLPFVLPFVLLPLGDERLKLTGELKRWD